MHLRKHRRAVERHLLPLLSALLISGCMSPRAGEKPQEQMELGWVDRSILHTPQYAWMDSGYAAYRPSTDMLEDMKQAFDSTRFLVVFGTWCSDTRRELPRFFKILDLISIPQDQVQLYGVDRSKQRPDGIPQQYRIERVPTIIVLLHDQEIGRIVESPKTTLEQDLFEILLQLMH